MALTLDEVAEHFRQWRSIKKPREPIPSELWNKVAQIAEQYSMSKITSRLGISYIQYKNNIPTRLSKSSELTEPIHFVSVPPVSSQLVIAVPVEKPLVLEFARGDGTSAKCHCVDVGMMRDTLSWFLKGG